MYVCLLRLNSNEHQHFDTVPYERDKTTGYFKHLTAGTIHAGLATGEFLQGTINVSKYRPQREAIVKTRESLDDKVCTFITR